MNSDELLREVYSDLKVLRRDSETAKESRERIHREIEDVRGAVEENRRCIQKQRTEIARIKTVFGLLGAAWIGLLGWLRWFQQG